MADWVESQFQSSIQYQQIATEYGAIQNNLYLSLDHTTASVEISKRMIDNRAKTIETLEGGLEKYKSQQDELELLMQKFEEIKDK